MSEDSAKPYLVRALHEWCVEQGYTPHIAVRVNAQTRVPAAYVKDGEIVLNVHPEATHMLTMDNEWILFNARFNGMSQEIAVPFSAVIGIFSKETGYGMGFQPAPEPVVAPLTAVATAPEKSAPSGDSTAADGAPSDKPTAPAAAPAKSKVSHLKVVK